ncbi:MAG: diguanylate cyclase domain-containing protein [Aeromicrobium sp.]
MVNEDKLSSVLSEFARTLITDFPIQGILDHLVERIVEVLPVTSTGVTLISPGMAPRYVAASDESAMRFERLQTDIGQGPCLLAYESGEAVSIPDLGADNRFSLFAPAALAAGMAAVFTFPLRHDEGRLGALDLYRDTPGELDPQDMDAAQTLADVAAAYLLNAQARDEARAASDRFHHDSLHDSLTGLPNRVLLRERLEHADERRKRSHSSAAVLFADLDGFKRVNDIHGHQTGDELLVAIAHRLSGLVRSGDTLARYSGDEFVFLCEDLHGRTDVEVLAKRIDDAFAEPFVLTGAVTVAVTASVGIAFAGLGEEITNELVVKADMAMYQAKRNGGAGHQIIDMRPFSSNVDRLAKAISDAPE